MKLTLQRDVLTGAAMHVSNLNEEFELSLAWST